jgi:transcription termination/antitermination protein NusG
MKTALQWYALYTRPCWEKRVAELLSQQQIENYCPLQKVLRQWSDRKKIIQEPLFKSYVFVRVPESGKLTVRQTDGVLNFVNYLGKPAIIRDEEIDRVKQFLNDYKNVRVENIALYVNDQVRVIGGPFMMMKGNVVEVKRKTVKILLPSLGFALTAEVEIANLEKE